MTIRFEQEEIQEAIDIAVAYENLSEYERQVSDAVVSLWIEAQKQGVQATFTVDEIHRAMPGGRGELSPKQRESIVETMEKLRRLCVKIDATKEMYHRGIIKKTGCYEIGSHYFECGKVEIGTICAFIIHGEPAILTYSRMLH